MPAVTNSSQCRFSLVLMDIQAHTPHTDTCADTYTPSLGLRLRQQLSWLLCLLGGGIEMLALLRARRGR